MNMGRILVGPVALLLLCGACSSGTDLRTINPRVIRDSTGESYQWICSQNDCRPEALSDTPSAPLCFGERGYYTSIGYRFVSIVADWQCAQGTAPICEMGPWFGRVVVCDNDGDCPQFDGFSYRSQHGSCQDESKAPTRIDYAAAVALCLWDALRPVRCTDSLVSVTSVQNALAATCTGQLDCPLPLPLSCHQP